MPAIGYNAGSPPTTPAKPPPPPPRPVANVNTGNNPRGVAITSHPGGQGVHQVIQHVFAGQNPAGQAAIVKGVLAGRADPQTARAVRDAVAGMGNRQAALYRYIPGSGGVNLGQAIDAFLKNAATAISDSASLGAGIGVKGGKGTSGAPGSHLTGFAAVQPMFGAGTDLNTLHGSLGLLKNAGSDAWNLPAGTVEGLYGLGKDLATLHFGNAFHSIVDPYVRLALHPGQAIEQHPLNSALMLAGPKAAIGRLAGGAARAGMLGDAAKAAASTAREPLHVGSIAGEPSPILEARSYSHDQITKAMQVAREHYMVKRGRNPNVAYPAPRFVHHVVAQAFNIGSEAKLNRIADEMTAVRQMAGRQERGQALDAVRKAAPPKEVRHVVSHILQSVIRSPQTAIADITHEINRLKAAQTGRRTVQELWNRKQVRDLSTALQHPDKLQHAFDAAAQIRPTIKAQDAYLVAHGLLDPEQAARRAVLPYALAHMGAKYDPVAEHFTTTSGAPLPTQDILDHLKVNGVPDPAYVGHFPGKVSPARFYSTYKLARGSLGKNAFTGHAFKTGAYDHTFEGLAGQVASRAEAVTRASLHDRVINRLSVKMPPEMRAKMVRQVFADARAGKRSVESARQEAGLIRQGLFTTSEANRFAHAARFDDHGNPIPGALELTPISTAPAHVLGLVKNLQHPKELNGVSGIELRALSHAIEDAQHSTTRNVVLAPSVATQRFADQFARADSTMKGIGKVTQQFRRTVLPYSTHWMTQIGAEAGLRSLLAGTLDPRYLRDGRALMKRLQGTEEGRAALMEMVNATFYNSKDPFAVHNPNAGVVSSAAHAFPPTRLLIAAHNRYANLIGHAMYTLEHEARVMGLGKLAHQQAQEFGSSWRDAVRLQGQTLDNLATRLRSDPALVAKFGRQIDETFGKYNKFSPKVRAAIQSYAPFLPWYLNAAKYVLWNLPAHHPVASSLLASLRQTINQDVQDGKQLPLNAYAMQELARISPFGIFTPPSSTPSVPAALGGQQMLGALLPEAQGSLYNLGGVNSFGEGPLKGPHGDVKAQSGPAAAAAVENLLESFLPLARYGRTIQEGGHPAYGTSTILSPQPEVNKGGVSVVDRILNPFYSFERAKGSGPPFGPAAATGASSGSGWGGSSPSSSSSGGWGGSSSATSGWGG